MSEPTATPKFRACETKNCSQWHVLVTWPDQREQYLDGFKDADAAANWVKHKSQAWFEAQQMNASRFAPQRRDDMIVPLESKSRVGAIQARAAAPESRAPELPVVDAIGTLIDILDTYRASAVEGRRARGD